MAGGQTELEIETGGGRRTEGLPGTGGQVRPVPRHYLLVSNPWETCGYVGHAGLCNRSLRFLVATNRNYLK